VAIFRRIRLALLALSLVLASGTVGYVLLGFGLLNAVYQTVTTVTTVGLRKVKPVRSLWLFDGAA
jgi:voltage-gated potassium channel